MGKAGDTGDYWEAAEYDLVTYAHEMVVLLDEFIDSAPADCEDLWFLYDSKAAAQRIIDAYEPEGPPEEGYKDNVISFLRYRATKR
jgi:hypothetical protein